MDAHGQLGTFLQARRAQLQPQDVGLPTYGDRRRVPGLRREELALLAGVSASYYTRLEQGASCHASVEVLDAIAGALRLEETERLHLRDLATACRHRRTVRRPPAERLAPAVRDLVSALGEVPVVVTGRRSDVLAWNTLGHALLAGHVDPTGPERPADRPNMARLVFLDAHVRELYVDWPAKARAVVGNLRLVAGRHPQDQQLTSLIGELTTRSAEFAGMWADHRVRACDSAEYELRHPLVGALTVGQQTLTGASEPEQSVVMVTAAPGSASQAALKLLAQATMTGAGELMTEAGELPSRRSALASYEQEAEPDGSRSAR
ncbi:helix-turn-helix domain-containing protein [Streptomyces sp. RKAG337]|uniref:helix-turn-helix domain-containing protein n=1 Tax=Streptomyces sp. RKAG337 TaxID=2893404 RepID=UPI0020335D3F|nr:helix-turn-helix transcriptional regulator [Streptomyces sp. RKAG337]MCM2430754.1 helix-turn-helix transcriptional regulator [Streptomyces sp. RKAG337]